MKNSFVLYYDLKDVFDFLTDEEAGRIIKAVFHYETEGELTVFEDRMLASTYKRITDNLDRNKKKYEKACEEKREAIKKRWETKKTSNDNDDHIAKFMASALEI